MKSTAAVVQQHGHRFILGVRYDHVGPAIAVDVGDCDEAGSPADRNDRCGERHPQECRHRFVSVCVYSAWSVAAIAMWISTSGEIRSLPPLHFEPFTPNVVRST